LTIDPVNLSECAFPRLLEQGKGGKPAQAATRFVREKMATPHRLADVDTHTDSVDIYVDYLGRLVNITNVQDASRPIVELNLQRTERGRREGTGQPPLPPPA
jgi:hypothetical protein